MTSKSNFQIQLAIFALVSAAFTNVYLVQPVLPVLQKEFSVSIVLVSFSVSAVVFGIAAANLPFGYLADQFPIQPIILGGGILVALSGLVCALTHNLWVLIAARFFQGLFIPSMTTCIAAYLARTLPADELNVVMGSYVSATVLGGLSGRLLGGWIHPPLHWRYAFVSASILTLIATAVALRGLPKAEKNSAPQKDSTSYWELAKRWDLLRIFLCAAGGFAVFSSVFNYLPYRLMAPPFNFSTQLTTLLYLVYVVGIFIGPTAGRLSNRFGSGVTLLAGSGILGLALLLLLLPYIATVIIGLIGVCAGFFSVHAAAVGALNRRIAGGQGRANALYVLFYYVGGWIGITGAGFAYEHLGWNALIFMALLHLLIPISAGIGEYRAPFKSRMREEVPYDSRQLP